MDYLYGVVSGDGFYYLGEENEGIKFNFLIILVAETGNLLYRIYI